MNRNQRRFIEENFAVARDSMNQNLQLNEEKKSSDYEKMMTERDLEAKGLALTNATKLNYSENKSYSDKFLA